MDLFPYDDSAIVVENMKTLAKEESTFPVLIGNEVTHFHSVTGGYNSTGDYYVANFIHEIQGPGSPYRVDTEQLSTDIEAHIGPTYFYMNAESLQSHDEYPDENFILSVKTQDYSQGEYSFTEALTKDIDRRERRERL